MHGYTEDARRLTRSHIRLSHAVVAFCAFIVFILLLFNDALLSMVRVWMSSRTYNHGFLIPLIAGYLVWLERDTLRETAPRPSLLGVVWLALAGLVSLAGTAAQAAVLQQLAFVGMLQGAVLTVFGPRIAWALCFPLFYLIFMVPIGDFAIAPLQDLTARHTTVLVRASGVPIHLENWVLSIPGGSFLVAEACAGVRFLIASAALGVLMAGLFFERWWKRILFVALSLLVPIGANVVRAYLIVMLAHWSDFEIAVGVDHIVYGFLFLAVVLVILIALGHVMRDTPEPTGSPRTAVDGMHAAQSPASTGRLTGLTLAALLLLAGIAAYAGALTRPGAPVDVAVSAPAASERWTRSAGGPADGWRARFAGADAEGMWRYDDGVTELSVYLGYYAVEYPGKEMIAHGNSLAFDISRDLLERGRLSNWEMDAIPSPLFAVVPMAGGSRTIWYWYVVGERVTGSAAQAKTFAAWARLLLSEVPAGVVAVSTIGSPRDTDALARFLRDSELGAILATGSFERLVVPAGN